MDIALQLVAYKEPGLTETMDAWAAQAAPPDADVRYEAWVTPAGGRATCGTWQQATAHETFVAREAPQYKLRARNAAHDDALARGVDGFIACDADAPPLAPGTLSTLLTRLNGDAVAAVCANPVAPTGPVGVSMNAGVYLKEALGGIHGQCHAVTAEAWRAAGPFSDAVDHTELRSVWLEEEYRFGKRLSRVGEVDYAFDAPVHNDVRRRMCRLRSVARRGTDDYCDRIGTETFRPF